LKSFQNALQLDYSNHVVKQLERIAAEKGDISHMILPDRHNDGLVDQRLRSSFKLVDGADPYEEI
jgi:hypothetical protein